MNGSVTNYLPWGKHLTLYQPGRNGCFYINGDGDDDDDDYDDDDIGKCEILNM